MHSLRRAALRSALHASKAASTTARIAPFASRTAAVKTALPVRLFSQTAFRAQEEKELEEAQRKAQEEFKEQVVADARQDVEESVAQTEADIQEAMQEVVPPVEEAAEQPAQTEQVEQPGQRQNARVEHKHSAFIRNIVFEVTEEHLTKAFAKYGNVTHAFIARDPRGLSKGYGFVSFDSAAELQAACDNVNGSFWHGRRVTCIPRAEKSETREPRGDRTREARNTPSEPTSQLYVGNIPYETTDAELNRLFRGVDNLKDVRVAVDRTTGWPRGFAHADFTSVEAATEAKARLEGATLGGRPLRFDFAHGFQKERRTNNYSREGGRQGGRQGGREGGREGGRDRY